jgi:hypothetical protein
MLDKHLILFKGYGFSACREKEGAVIKEDFYALWYSEAPVYTQLHGAPALSRLVVKVRVGKHHCSQGGKMILGAKLPDPRIKILKRDTGYYLQSWMASSETENENIFWRETPANSLAH